MSTEEEARTFLIGNNRDTNPFYYSVAYIKSTGEIYTHGKIYEGDNTEIRSDIDELESGKANVIHTHNISDLISDEEGKVVVSQNNSFVLKNILELMPTASSSLQLKFYCIAPVTIHVNQENPVEFSSNSTVNLYFAEGDVFTLSPSSDSAIMSLDAWPGAINTFYSWLEGVQSFSNIVFDMNSEDMYTKWNQNNQGDYHVQKAQYTNCVF